MLDDDRDAVGPGIGERMEVGVGDLRKRAVAEGLVRSERAGDVPEIDGLGAHAVELSRRMARNTASVCGEGLAPSSSRSNWRQRPNTRSASARLPIRA
jgi:hypothetical protein